MYAGPFLGPTLFLQSFSTFICFESGVLGLKWTFCAHHTDTDTHTYPLLIFLNEKMKNETESALTMLQNGLSFVGTL